MLFIGISSAMPKADFVGGVGSFIGFFNRDFFGSFGIIYPFALLYPAWKIYKYHHHFSWNLGSGIAGGLLLFLSVLLALAMLKPSFAGLFGVFVLDILKGYIGTLGSLLCSLAGIIIGFSLSFGKRLDTVILEAFAKAKKDAKSLKPASKPAAPSTQNIIKPRSAPKIKKAKNTYELQSYKNALETNEYSQQNLANKNLEFPNKNLEFQEQNLEFSNEILEFQNENLEFQDENAPKITATGVEILSEVAENKELLAQIEKGYQEVPKDFKLPSLDFLAQAPKKRKGVSESEIDSKIADLLEKLRKFKIDGDVIRTYSGPVVTTFEFKPAPNVAVRKILNLQDDLAMALRAQTIRIQAPIPGKDVVGIEIPNSDIETIYLREVLESEIFSTAKSELTIALGKDIVGAPFVTDLKKLPHLLIAGTTGSGKSVGINAMLLSLLYRNSPQTLRLIMIDPKMLEFSMYEGIPHLLTPVITEAKKAVNVLENLVSEMERRYKLMAASKTKNIESYNAKMKEQGEASLPFIVVIIDELADLMMTSGKDVEFSIARLAQMARASGIHLIVATQRPSVDVVTGLIKANLPSRISYRVGQKIDSKVILDQLGAESLLGRGDMLFTPPSSPGLVRLHAPFASEAEIETIVEFLKEQGEALYDESFLSEGKDTSAGLGGSAGGEVDELFEQAKEVILSERKTSISYLQRRLTIGYNRAANIIEQLQNAGFLSEPNAKGQREIL
ncbi:MAG: DNA translocase FtsK 4TM domain-containing protein [Campylobacter sp.]|nr:DNA translocase FtsK 4TM domain-containing protein [Campylobacter sp.]MDD7599424.1 DNA translocase FtsK 4TM domain-containing protein [Campylobacteraceae bacterium]MDY5886713.1 DNA translocase FtsK 4TM domain-containing protein [Campylobacter sp.]